MSDTMATSKGPAGESEDPTGRLAGYVAATQSPLDLLAMLTLWIVVVPPGAFGSAWPIALVARVALSLTYATDLAIRARLARRHWRYVRTHRLGLLAVLIPPLRLFFSFRLVHSTFRRGNLDRFLLTALLLVINLAAVVFLYERDATGSNIRTLANALWWAFVTVTTVGYGDYYPVTVAGRVAAVLNMIIGLLTLAVVTAQVASSFVEQAAHSKPTITTTTANAAALPEVTLEDLAERLARIEHLLTAPTAATPQPPEEPPPP
jgi:voltage-gated potassium channel